MCYGMFTVIILGQNCNGKHTLGSYLCTTGLLLEETYGGSTGVTILNLLQQHVIVLTGLLSSGNIK